MKYGYILKAALIAGVVTAVAAFIVPAHSAHQQVFINGQAVHPAVVWQIQQATGMRLSGGHYSWDGQYLYDGRGNAVPLSYGGGPTRYPGGSVGETYPGGSSWGNQNTGIGGVYDNSGGCEGGSCVNIID